MTKRIKRTAAAILDIAERKGALKYGRFRLSAGGTSSYYFDGRLITLDPEGAVTVASVLLPILWECKADAVAGPTIGADPIVATIAAMSFTKGRPIEGLIVRKEAKQHGGGRLIEGPLKAEKRVAVVDDTCTTGTSLMHAIAAVEAAECEVVKVICVLDRGGGGREEIKRRGYDFMALLEANNEGEIRAM